MVDELIDSTNGYLGLLSLGGSESVRTENFVGTPTSTQHHT